jgi:hypothetical protein
MLPAPTAQTALSRRAATESGLVSPTERPVSFPPLKTIRVLCICAPNFLTASFCASKSTWITTRSSNFGVFFRSDRIGPYFLQTGHQEACISTRIGFPAAMAASKASGVYGTVCAAKAGPAETTKAPSRPAITVLRDVITKFPVCVSYR